MGKISLEHARLDPSVSVSLVIDEITKVKNWRYRFLVVSTDGTYRKHDLKDYHFEDFDSISQFKSRIEYERFRDQ
jgi:hypothetical protein